MSENMIPWREEAPANYNFSEFSNGATSFSSIKPQDTASKIALYNLTQDRSERLSEHVNEEIPVSDIICQTVTVTSDNGIQSTAPRIILITPDMKGYHCVSNGIYNAIGKLFEIFGAPHWEDPIIVVPKIIKKGKNQILTLSLKE